jgi:hypothetical protein
VEVSQKAASGTLGARWLDPAGYLISLRLSPTPEGKTSVHNTDDTAHGQLTDVLDQLNAIIQRLPAAEGSVAAYQQRADRYLTLDTLS